MSEFCLVHVWNSIKLNETDPIEAYHSIIEEIYKAKCVPTFEE